MNSQPPPLSGTFPIGAQDYRDRVIMIGASAAAFAVACALPALKFQNVSGVEQSWNGGIVLLLGWMGALIGQFGWYANVLLLGSWISLGFRWRPGAILFPVIALLIAAHSFALFGQEVPADEGGVNKLTLTHLMPGFYFWVASIVIALAGGVFARGRK